MKQALQLKMGQHLTMTPQLQQAIRLLQLSTLDLQQEIQEALESNPMLEVTEEDSASDNAADQASSEAQVSNHESVSASAQTAESEEIQAADSDWNEDIPSELSTDSNWEDTYQTVSSSSSSSHDFSDMEMESNDTADETLQDHLSWQLNLTPMSRVDELIATSLIDGINVDGYLNVELDSILEYFHQQDDEQLNNIELDEIEAVLRRIQQFDPPGVAARNLSECLAIQLQQLPEDTEYRPEAIKVVTQYIHLLGNHDYKQLMRKARIREPQLLQAINLIRTLNPKPGSMITSSQSEYVIPDVLVYKEKGVWQVSLNPEVAPKLRINDGYADLIRRADTSPDNTYLKNHLQEARWFIKSLLSRNDTLMKVTREIVRRQEAFLENGDEAMRPMVLHDIAEAVEMHESTISRVTTQKYMHTPRGIFELKYFFSSHVTTVNGGTCSSTAIRALIKKLVIAENPVKPLSDNKIALLLEEQGINVARRTIAKYRESLSIPPSNERKRLV
ncbi:RNA polymerase factor sigma-54 [Amphritea sp. 2_MG-2023]|uniref:RNA polymerase factor sigma-54 n=1 Tax=Amphritea TaxID=515417 RepID=UPI001C06DDE6|nr:MULTISPECIES: RNA polymerase factor sigma-54 [Amphritea]MBU2966124.1 RNA polymerase factor sigma-54 [Amphritea atlantica]MDO6418221.1 RNA polymerase factor sigma-54 [Amphritea sp. 2_MG-2023]MDX2422743.1 RNA polymerase factor sigma-54 [Amphritea sp.]